MSPDQQVSECPQCGVGVKKQLGTGQDLTLSELSESEVRQGEYFFCIMCQIAWDNSDRIPYDLPMMSSGPSGFLSGVTSGKAVSDGKTSNYRLLGYDDEGKLLLRDVGELAFARSDTDRPAPPSGKLESQLGEVVSVKRSGYPEAIQDVLNAIRPAYCIHATVGESEKSGELEFDAHELCCIVEAVPVNYALEAEYVPEFADAIWEADVDQSQFEDQIPQGRRTLHANGRPAADVYVFPKTLPNENNASLFGAMLSGRTHHLETFTTNFTGVFINGLIDVIFIAPTDRPYFVVYCLGGDCVDLSHELRAELELPVVHRGRDSDRNTVYDIRYNPHYVRRATEQGEDVLVLVNGEGGMINIESGTVEGDYFKCEKTIHEIVVTVSDAGTTVEVARLRAPSARINTGAEDRRTTPNRGDSTKSDGVKSQPGSSTHSTTNDIATELTPEARSRLADIVEFQPTSNSELADAWDFSSGSEVYQYLSSTLDDYYYRDERNYIRATDRAKKLIETTE